MSYQLWLNRMNFSHSNTIFQVFLQINNYHTYVDYVGISNNLHRMEDYFRYKIHPIDNYKCGLMMVHNLAEPEWLSIMCDQPLLSYVLCTVDSTDMDYSQMFLNKESISQKEWCQYSHIKKKDNCFVFYWQIKEYLFVSKFAYSIVNLKSQLSSLEFIFIATSAQLSPILLPNKNSPDSIQSLEYFNSFNKFAFSKKFQQRKNAAGFVIYKTYTFDKDARHHLFRCRNNAYISQSSVCDGVSDCSDNNASDETGCICKLSHFKNKNKNRCKIIQLTPTYSVCSLLYNTTKDNHCIPYGQESIDYSSNYIISILHKSLKEIHNGFNDQTVGIIGHLEHENGSNAMPLVNSVFSCKDPNHLLCRHGQTDCFNIGDICKYTLNINHNLVPCKTGEHIEDCKYFECNLMFKCPKSYCIPWKYVCDGKWDCPRGFDELGYYECRQYITCKHLFKCKNRNNCIHLSNVCDGNVDCILGEDEMFCKISTFICPTICNCLVFAIRCLHLSINLEQLYNALPFAVVSILYSQEFFHINKFNKFENVRYLILVHNNISHVCNYTSNWILLEILDLSYNLISNIEKNCFYNMQFMTTIKINSNKIHKIHSNSFSFMPNLRFLNLSNNFIVSLPSKVFNKVNSISNLLLKKNDFKFISFQALTDVEIKTLETSKYFICCVIPPGTDCIYPYKPWYMSCSQLLPNLNVRISIGIISLALIIINISSLLLHCIKFKQSKSFNVLIIAINLNDMMCATYLTLLFSADSYFGKHFSGNEKAWRGSPVCFFLFFLSLSFSPTSPFLLSVLSLSRNMVFLYPFDSKFKDAVYNFRIVLNICTFLMFCSLVTTLITRFLFIELPISLCVPFIDPTNSFVTFKMITWIVAIVQLAASIVTIILYFKLFKWQKTSNQLPYVRKRSYYWMTVQLIIISFSNILCWFPSSTIFLISLFVGQYPPSMVLWTTILIIPINSIVNPLIFIIATLRKLRRN